MTFFGHLGDVVKDVTKVVTDTAEKAVQVTGVGKVAESMGIKVDENIHKNGFNTTVTGVRNINRVCRDSDLTELFYVHIQLKFGLDKTVKIRMYINQLTIWINNI